MQIEEMLKYIEEWVEKPNLNNLPVCPFAHKARIENKIKFVVQELDEKVLEYCLSFESQTDYEILIIIHPTKDGITIDRLSELTNFINTKLSKCSAFSGHPDHAFMINGIYTRREPYPNLQIIFNDLAIKSENILKKTKYYSKWTSENLNYVRIYEA